MGMVGVGWLWGGCCWRCCYLGMGGGRLDVLGVGWVWLNCCCLVVGRGGLGVLVLAGLRGEIT